MIFFKLLSEHTNQNISKKVKNLQNNTSIYNVYDTQTRVDRATLLARMFSNTVDILLERKKKELSLDIQNAASIRIQKAKEYELSHLTRNKLMMSYGIKNLYDALRAQLKQYVSQDIESVRKIIEEQFIEAYGKEYVEEAKRERAEIYYSVLNETVDYRIQEYKKMLDHFEGLFQEALIYINQREELKITMDYISTEGKDTTTDNPDGENPINEFNEDPEGEKSYKDNWMFKAREVSSLSSLTEKVRRALNTIVVRDVDGYIDEDDLGNARYMNISLIHSVLVKHLSDRLLDSSELIPLLEELKTKHLWADQVIEEIKEDEALFSQFFQCYCKDTIKYWVQNHKYDSDGNLIRITTSKSNELEGIEALKQEWQSNHDIGVRLGKLYPIYTNTGGVDRDAIEKIGEYVNFLSKIKYDKITKENIELLNEVLKSAGILISDDELERAISGWKYDPDAPSKDPFKAILDSVGLIISIVIRDKEGEIFNSDKKTNLISIFNGIYSTVAYHLSKVTGDTIESTAREGGKSYYAHTNPNYLGRTMIRLKNEGRSLEEFNNYMQEEFKQIQFFVDNKGNLLNTWLRFLSDPEKGHEYRKILDHKVLLNHDKIDYKDWDPLEVLLCSLAEYDSSSNMLPTSDGLMQAWYQTPILADAPSCEFIKFIRYTTTEDIITGETTTFKQHIAKEMVNLVIQEYNRIMLVRQRNSDPERKDIIANFDKRGLEFCFLPALNDLEIDGKKFIDVLSEKLDGSEYVPGTEIESFIIEQVTTIMDEGFKEELKRYEETGLLDKNKNGNYKYEKVLSTIKEGSNDFIEKLEEYYWNSIFATSQIIQIMTTDLAFYKNMEDFQKRFKQIHAPSLRMNTKATYNGKLVGSEYETTVLLEDNEIVSSTIAALIKVIGKNPNLSVIEKANILAKYGYHNKVIEGKKYVEMKDNGKSILVKTSLVNVADAQALRSLSSYRKIMVMSGEWNEDYEKAYNNFIENKWSADDFHLLLQTKKPFVYTQIKKLVGYTMVPKVDEDGNMVLDEQGNPVLIPDKNQPIYQKVPVQHKNSEFLLMAAHHIVANALGSSSKLVAINQFMENNNIDVIQFESTTKVGKQGIVNLNSDITEEERLELEEKFSNGKINSNEYLKGLRGHDLTDEKKITELLESYVYTTDDKGNKVFNPTVVHEIPYKDYGIQVATPEHSIDKTQLIGTQIRKLITADISDDAKFELEGKKYTKKELLSLYDSLIVENLLDSYEQLREVFKDKKKLSEMLQSEIRGNDRYGNELLKACMLEGPDGHEEFVLPLYDPIHSQRIQTLLNSLIKKHIVKQKIKGGALIQASSYGLSDDLQIVFKDKDGKEFKYDKNSGMDIEALMEAKEVSIACYECYMPAYSKSFFEPLMDPETHTLDIKKLPMELREFIGYRVPTEDKYSMVPLRIKGFLPQQNGSAIMLPAEITTISGSDFDVSKLYIMVPEFEVKQKINTETLIEEFNSTYKNTELLEKDIETYYMEFSDKNFTFEKNSLEDTIHKFIWRRPKRYTFKRLQKIEYDYNDKPENQSREARNNAIIDLMWGILTHPDTTIKMLNPCGFDNLKRSARICTLLELLTQRELEKTLKSIEKKCEIKDVYTVLESLSLDELNKLADKYKKNINPLSPSTFVYFHQQNMNGSKLIGIYANHNANHALLQHTNIGVREEIIINGNISLPRNKAGIIDYSLHSIKNNRGQYISRNNAEFLAASVDNVKEQVLSSLFQNTLTADYAMLLSRMGYTSLEIGLFLNQPIIKKIVNTYFKERKNNKPLYEIIKEVKSNYRNKYKNKSTITEYTGNVNNNENNIVQLSNLELARFICVENCAMYNIDSEKETTEYKDNYILGQLEVLKMFEKVVRTSNDLKTLITVMRADTATGTIGPSLANTEIKHGNMRRYQKRLTEINFTLNKADIINSSIFFRNAKNFNKDADINDLRKVLLQSELPFLQAFQSLGLDLGSELIAEYFPQLSPLFKNIVAEIVDRVGKVRLNEKTLNSIFNDYITFLLTDLPFFGNEKGCSITEKRNYFINEFPLHFITIIKENKDIANNNFIKNLRVIKDSKTGIYVLIFKDSGRLTTDLRDLYIRDWESLLYSNNPKSIELALNLFRYNFYRTGFAFGSNTFSHLTPVTLRKIIPGYENKLKNLPLGYSSMHTEFIDQYFRNHLNNRTLVPEVKDYTAKSFKNNDDKIYIEVPINTIEGVDYLKIDDDVYKPYIAVTINSNIYYYKYDSYTKKYINIQPLGIPNKYIEYEIL